MLLLRSCKRNLHQLNRKKAENVDEMVEKPVSKQIDDFKEKEKVKQILFTTSQN